MNCCLKIVSKHYLRDDHLAPDWNCHLYLLTLLVHPGDISEELHEHLALRSVLPGLLVGHPLDGPLQAPLLGVLVIGRVVGHLSAGVVDTGVAPLLVALQYPSVFPVRS